MTLLKWIRCTPGTGNEQAFYEAQKSWHKLAGVPGFLAQTGGWFKGGREAHIVALWQCLEAYDYFMAHYHDPIFEKSGQAGTYRRSRVELFSAELMIPGHKSIPWAPGIPGETGFLRLAYCSLRADRRDSFLNTQKQVWNPGMAEHPGLLGGSLFLDLTGENALVLTCWASQNDHQDYRDRLFPPLKEQARTEKDLLDLSGAAFEVLPEWTVRPGQLESEKD